MHAGQKKNVKVERELKTKRQYNPHTFSIFNCLLLLMARK